MAMADRLSIWTNNEYSQFGILARKQAAEDFALHKYVLQLICELVHHFMSHVVQQQLQHCPTRRLCWHVGVFFFCRNVVRMLQP
jgi:hypothetical protein